MCSRVMWANNGQAVVVGRNMDWMDPMAVDLYLLPRGIARDGMTGPNTLTWKARYGSVVAAAPDSAPTDGMNENGLAGHLLWLVEADYGKFDPSRPSLNIGLWLQFYLDQFGTVEEAVQFTQQTPFQLVTATFNDRKVTLHLALEDPTGDSAIIEYTDGKPMIYHGKEYTVMTNSPPYQEQLRQLRQYKGFGGSLPLPGTSEAADRFVRGAYYLKNLPEPRDYWECMASILSVMRSVAQPFGVVEPTRPHIAPTRWRSVCDLTKRIYHFESAMSPCLGWVKMRELDFQAGTPIRKIDLINHPDRMGDYSEDFQPDRGFCVPSPGIT